MNNQSVDLDNELLAEQRGDAKTRRGVAALHRFVASVDENVAATGVDPVNVRDETSVRLMEILGYTPRQIGVAKACLVARAVRSAGLAGFARSAEDGTSVSTALMSEVKGLAIAVASRPHHFRRSSAHGPGAGR